MAKEEEVASSNPNFLPVESWDFGKYSCEDAEKKLMAIGINKGQFIVRDNRDPGTFSLSVRDNDPQKGDHVMHYRILEMVGGNGIFIFEGSVFRTLSELVRHYQMNIDGLCCLLTEVCPKENPNTIGLGMDRLEIPWEALWLHKHHGQGYFSEVRIGVWNGNTPVAVKTLKEGTSADFLAEANFMKKVSHERFVQLDEVCSEREPIYKVTSNGSSLDYLKDGTGKDTKLTTHVDMGAQITIAKKSNEKELDNVPPDDGGMVKEGPIEAANENTNLLCPLKKEELKETDKNAALGEQTTSLPPASNNKTWITKFVAHVCSLIAYGPKNKWIFLFVLLGIFGNVGANGQGIKFELKPYRYVPIATDETIAATDPVCQPHSYLIFACGGNYPVTYECTEDLVEKNRSCSIVYEDNNQTECKGLRISGNKTRTHLVVDGSKLTHDNTAFCILEQVPNSYILYTLGVSKKQHQDIDECASSPCVNGGMCVDGHDSYTCNCAKGYNGANCEIDNVQQEFPRNINIAPNSTVDATDLVPIPAPKTNHYKVACFILVFILVIAIAIVIKKKFPCIRAWWKKIWMERVPTTDPDQGQNTTVLHDLDRTIDSVA